jgi:hypothetical protein
MGHADNARYSAVRSSPQVLAVNPNTVSSSVLKGG